MSYQGWSNYETWCVALWLDNDEGLYNYWQDVASEVKEENTSEDDGFDLDTAVDTLAERLKDEVTESAPDLKATMWSDLLTSALGEVDWHEIAKARLEE